MEQEEGMNHLWIQLFPVDFSPNDKAEILIDLPDGLYRAPNLNGYEESSSNGILLDLSQDKDVLLELYTQSPVNFGSAPIYVRLRYHDSENNRNELFRELTLQFVNGDEMDALEIDEHVIERVKEIVNPAANLSSSHDDLVNIRPRTYEVRSNAYAYLEKKYRIDY